MLASRMQILLEMLTCGLLEIRKLCQRGENAQAGILTDAFHNIPDYALNPEKWSPDYFVDAFNRYDEMFPKSERMVHYDYLSYLNRLK